ncbi:hypothetical protein J4455_05650 [Candidatus Woesearchaeota archaeon]|nr:hypothetical protein [Candidatus Woesearchaeota archaeon]
MRGFWLFLIIGLLLIAGCNRGDSATGKAVQELEEVKEVQPQPIEEVKEKPEEVKPQVTTPAKPKPKEKQLEVHFIDVGYGDAILLKEENNVILVDCGRSDDIIYNYLKKLNVNDIDLLIVTVPTKEHVGGCDKVLKNFNVKKLLDNGRSPKTEVYEDYSELIDEAGSYDVAHSGDEYTFGNANLNIVGSNNREEKDNSNVVVLKVSYNDIDFLLTSDCDEVCEKKLPIGIQAEIFKVANHGSLLSTSYDFVTRVSPKISVITVDQDNQYSNPKQQVLDRLSGTTIYRNDIHGTIIVKTNGKTYSVDTEK